MMRCRHFAVTTPAGNTVTINGEPDMDPKTLQVLTTISDLAYVQYSSASVPTCLMCGCTDGHACPGGCWWANDERTLCSACAPTAIAVAWHLIQEEKQ